MGLSIRIIKPRAARRLQSAQPATMPRRFVYSFMQYITTAPTDVDWDDQMEQDLNSLPFAYYWDSTKCKGVVELFEEPRTTRNTICKVLYLGFSEELTPTSGALHLQGMFELDKDTTLPNLKRWLSMDANIQKAIDPDALFKYTRKTDDPTFLSGPYEYKTYRPFNEGQGKRTDIHSAYERIQELAAMGWTERAILLDITRQFPGIGIRYPGGIEKTISLEVEAHAYKTSKLTVFRPFQQYLIDKFTQPADDRTIIWVYDAIGGAGKSRLAAHVRDHMGGIVLAGKKNDVAYVYQGEPIVIFDLSRTQEDNCKGLFSTAEDMKNGALFSGKYTSKIKRFKPPHVCFFANFQCPPGSFSADRLLEMDLATWQPPTPLDMPPDAFY